jgi:exodeoxyribonuclease V alpha subunit
VTELWEPVDAADRRYALSSTGLLAEFNRAGVLDAADVLVAQRVGRLAGEPDQRVLLATALAVRAVRHGSVCVDLATVREIAPDTASDTAPDTAPELPWPSHDDWGATVVASPLLTLEALRWEFGLLYLDRYWHQEVQLCADLSARIGQPGPSVDVEALHAGVQRVFPGATYHEQRAASRGAVTSWTTVLTGGPGTGKTTTVAGLLALLAEQAQLAGDPLPRIALSAPTGKAAARLQAAVAAEVSRLPEVDRERVGTVQAVTLHRLLGTRRDNATRFRHHRGNRLPHDVVVVDESSMVSLTMMTRLLEAVRPEARLVLVGDPDQLASVEAGAVLADLVSGLTSHDPSPVLRLATTHRYGEEIAALAEALRSGSADAVLDVLRSGATQVEFLESDEPAPLLHSRVVEAAVEVRRHAEAGRAAEAVAALDAHRLLCAHRDGPFGVHHWNRQVEHWLAEATGDPLYEPMYVGRPLLVTANDYGLGVYNGDAGVVVRTDDGPRAVIAGAQGLAHFATSRMSAVETMFATTIHKSQGSQAAEVTVLLPPPESRLLTRELFYTAVTRAEQKVRVVGTEASVRAAVERRAVRASGLRQRLA